MTLANIFPRVYNLVNWIEMSNMSPFNAGTSGTDEGILKCLSLRKNLHWRLIKIEFIIDVNFMQREGFIYVC